MTDHTPAIVLVLAVILIVGGPAWWAYAKYVAKPSWDGTENALGKAFEKRKREERDWDAEHDG